MSLRTLTTTSTSFSVLANFANQYDRLEVICFKFSEWIHLNCRAPLFAETVAMGVAAGIRRR